MAQVSDVSLANQGFSSFRTELNNILTALNTSHIGSSAPSSVATGTIWVDNGTSGTLKVKINDGSDNIELFSINITSNAIQAQCQQLVRSQKLTQMLYLWRLL